MSFLVEVGKKVACEGYHPGSIISRTAFTATVKALKAGTTSTVDTAYNGNVTLYANSPTDNKAFKIGTAVIKNGVGTSTNMTITSVYNCDSSRKITAVADNSSTNTGTITVGVWFKGDASQYDDDEQACDGKNANRKTNYVALPGTNMCGTAVVVANADATKTSTGYINDIGPWFDSKHCNYDYYWNTGTEPKAITNKGKSRNAVCGTKDTNDYNINGAIIDISPSMTKALGGSSTITNALWRFS